MTLCAQCILPETFPGISFNAEGVCNYCQGYVGEHALAEKKKTYEEKFNKLIEEHRGKAGYDLIMAYSGGKDSTYTLDIFVSRYKLRVLALTFDNSFISPLSFENIRRICSALGVDHYLVRPNPAMLHTVFRTAAQQELFSPKTRERASTICTSCIGFVKSIVLRTAIEKSIPFVGFGWSPGQAPLESSVMKTNALFAKSTQQAIYDPLHRIAGDAIAPYFPGEEHFQQAERFPWNIHPLAFLDYDEEKMIQRNRELGWEKPGDTDANSTNCLLNALANRIHKERYKFHPYAWELANMVRCGAMTQEFAIAKIEEMENPEIVLMAQKRLGLL
jgi:tRNA(Ile)-lysidine synthase TilS/MesJ